MNDNNISKTYVNRRGELMREYKFGSWKRRRRIQGIGLTPLDVDARLCQPKDAVCFDVIRIKRGRIELKSDRLDLLTE